MHACMCMYVCTCVYSQLHVRLFTITRYTLSAPTDLPTWRQLRYPLLLTGSIHSPVSTQADQRHASTTYVDTPFPPRSVYAFDHSSNIPTPLSKSTHASSTHVDVLQPLSTTSRVDLRARLVSQDHTRKCKLCRSTLSHAMPRQAGASTWPQVSGAVWGGAPTHHPSTMATASARWL